MEAVRVKVNVFALWREHHRDSDVFALRWLERIPSVADFIPCRIACVSADRHMPAQRARAHPSRAIYVASNPDAEIAFRPCLTENVSHANHVRWRDFFVVFHVISHFIVLFQSSALML